MEFSPLHTHTPPSLAREKITICTGRSNFRIQIKLQSKYIEVKLANKLG